MRKLNIQDAFALARIIKSADIKDEIAEFANRIATKKSESKNQDETINTEAVGLEFVVTLITSLSNKSTEQEFYALLANIRGDITAEDVSSLSITEVLDNVKTIIKENDIKNFFISLSIEIRTYGMLLQYCGSNTAILQALSFSDANEIIKNAIDDLNNEMLFKAYIATTLGRLSDLSYKDFLSMVDKPHLQSNAQTVSTVEVEKSVESYLNNYKWQEVT